jgi:glycine reductase
MDLEVQRRVKEAADAHGKDELIVLLGGAEAEASGLAAETVAAGDPTFAGPLAGVPLGLKAYHIVEPEIRAAVNAAIYEEQVGIMEMVLDTEAIAAEVREIRTKFTGA